MFLYKGVKIKGAWKHDDGRGISSGWVENVTPAQLADYDVVEVPDIAAPSYDIATHYISESPDGSYITTAYTQEELGIRDSDKAKQELYEIDVKSMRDVREWIASQPSAPQTLKDRESAAVLARGRVI